MTLTLQALNNDFFLMLINNYIMPLTDQLVHFYIIMHVSVGWVWLGVTQGRCTDIVIECNSGKVENVTH